MCRYDCMCMCNSDWVFDVEIINNDRNQSRLFFSARKPIKNVEIFYPSLIRVLHGKFSF